MNKKHISLADDIIQQIIKEQQPKALTNWTGFGETPTTKEDAIKAIRTIPKKFNIRMKKPPTPPTYSPERCPDRISQSNGFTV